MSTPVRCERVQAGYSSSEDVFSADALVSSSGRGAWTDSSSSPLPVNALAWQHEQRKFRDVAESFSLGDDKLTTSDARRIYLNRNVVSLTQ
jgi:hypothetical protein